MSVKCRVFECEGLLQMTTYQVCDWRTSSLRASKLVPIGFQICKSSCLRKTVSPKIDKRRLLSFGHCSATSWTSSAKLDRSSSWKLNWLYHRFLHTLKILQKSSKPKYTGCPKSELVWFSQTLVLSGCQTPYGPKCMKFRLASLDRFIKKIQTI